MPKKKRNKRKLKVNVNLYFYKPYLDRGKWANEANVMELEAWKRLRRTSVPKTPVHISLRLDDNENPIRACKHAKNFFIDYFFNMYKGKLTGFITSYEPPMRFEEIECIRRDLMLRFREKYKWDGISPIMCAKCSAKN